MLFSCRDLSVMSLVYFLQSVISLNNVLNKWFYFLLCTIYFILPLFQNSRGICQIWKLCPSSLRILVSNFKLFSLNCICKFAFVRVCHLCKSVSKKCHYIYNFYFAFLTFLLNSFYLDLSAN
jgi:hypothetical protein